MKIISESIDRNYHDRGTLIVELSVKEYLALLGQWNFSGSGASYPNRGDEVMITPMISTLRDLKDASERITRFTSSLRQICDDASEAIEAIEAIEAGGMLSSKGHFPTKKKRISIEDLPEVIGLDELRYDTALDNQWEK